MGGIKLVDKVPEDYVLIGSQPYNGGFSKANEMTLGFGAGEQSSEGMVLVMTNPLGASGQNYELHLTASSGRIGFTEDITITNVYRFAQGQSVIWEDTRFKGSGAARASYYYAAKLANTVGFDTYGYAFKIFVAYYAAALPVHQPEKRGPRPGPNSEPPRGKALAKDPILHVVKSGDYLRALSQRYYGDPNRWNEIYEENRSLIGSNPDRLSPGITLTIP